MESFIDLLFQSEIGVDLRSFAVSKKTNQRGLYDLPAS